jgi:hypothetical protein
VTATTGVRLVLADCADGAREAEFNERYDAYAVALTEPGHLVTAARFAATGPGSPAYAALYDIELDDPGEAWPLTAPHSSRVVGELGGLLDVTLRATYARLRPAPAAEPPLELTLVLADPRPGVGRADVEEWYRATDRDGYALVEGSPDPPLFLEVRSTGAGGAAVDSTADLLEPRLSAEFRRLSWHSRKEQ